MSIAMQLTPLLSAVLLLQSPVAPQDTVVIRRNLTAPTEASYRVDFSMKQMIDVPEMGGAQPFDLSGIMKNTLKIGKYDDQKKTAPLEASLTEIRMKFEGLAAMMEGVLGGPPPKEMRFTGAIDELNRLSALKAAAQSSLGPILNVAVSSWGNLASYPVSAVKVGDTWQTVVPKVAGFWADNATFNYKLVGTRAVDGKTLAVIEGDGTLRSLIDLSQMMGSGGMGGSVDGQPGPRMYGPLKVKVNLDVDWTTGLPYQFSAVLSGKQTLDIPAMGMARPVEGTISTKMTLLKPGESTLPKVETQQQVGETGKVVP